MEYKAPLKQMKFLLHDVFQAKDVWVNMPELNELNDDLVDAILDESAKIAEHLLSPLNRSGDEEGVLFNNGTVTTPTGFIEAFKTYAEGGWIGLGGNPEFGGQGLPKMLTVLVEEMWFGANTSFALYSVLTSGAALALNTHGSKALKSLYLPKLYSGQWTGAMCLTESHAGTDLGIIRTKAEPLDDSSYSITGSKIFITGGEQDLTENIIHFVLAKLPDAPAGPKGISLFLVPKVHLNDDGSLGDANGVSCGSIEHKMGIHASATCVMNFDDAKGYLVGELNQGLAAMFTMMNYERLSIGLQGLGCGEVSYQCAVQYAQERLQSRAPSGTKEASKEADPIIVHPDVRRMLLTPRAFLDGGRAFAIYTGMLLDTAKFSSDEAERKHAEGLVTLLTPVAKAFISDKGFDCCLLGQSVLGGHGYIREWGQEQLVRDARIAQIYEGTNGIQALDLVKRKVLGSQGALVDDFLNEIDTFIEANTNIADECSENYLKPLTQVKESLKQATTILLAESKTDPNLAGAASCDYLHLFGYTVYAFVWARIALTAHGQEDTFYQEQLLLAQFFMERLLPQAQTHYLAAISDPALLMTMKDFQFER